MTPRPLLLLLLMLLLAAAAAAVLIVPFSLLMYSAGAFLFL